MLKDERLFRRRAAAEDQSGADQLVERSAQLIMRAAGNRREYFVRKFTADYRADLRHFLDRREPIKPSQKRILQTRRDRQRRQWSCEDVAAIFFPHQATL